MSAARKSARLRRLTMLEDSWRKRLARLVTMMTVEMTQRKRLRITRTSTIGLRN